MPKAPKLLEKLTYANIVSTLCLFLLLGGGAYAATKLPKNSVGSKQLKNGAVTGQKVAANTLTGANINASTLGTVPNATHASSADSASSATNASHAASADNAGHATSADNADKLGGLLASSFQARITGTCEAGKSVASVGEEGGVNCTANGGPPSGPAGGTLSGTYPDPSLASNSVDTANFKATATAPNAAKLNGTESSGFIQGGAAAGGALGGTYPNPTLATKPVVASGSSSATTVIGVGCTHYESGEVTINAPSAGTVVISANAWLHTFHTLGVNDNIEVFIGTTEADCASTAGFSTAYGISSTLPTYSGDNTTIPVSRVVGVGSGSHTFYLNGKLGSGSDTEQFYYTGMTAIFIPS